jgi:trigger factor
MQVQELPAQELKRSFKVSVEATEIETNINDRLVEIGKTVKMDGFRPGKVPMPVLVKRYGDSVRGEVIEKTVQQAVDKAIADRNLRPAMRPEVKLDEPVAGAPISFSMDFEVLPEVKPMDFKLVKLEKMIASVADSEVDSMVEKMAKQTRGPQTITEVRGAQMGDVLLIDFDGSVDGKSQPGMKSEDHRLELGSQSFIPGFEEQLVGTKKGDDVVVKVTFPAGYHAADLSCKPAEFKVLVKDILAHQPLTLDDALAGEIGFETMADLRGKVKDRMQADHDQLTREVMKRQLLDQLADAHSFSVPQSMVEAEFQSIWERVEQEKQRGVTLAEDEGKDAETQKLEYRAIAERRVRLGLVLAEVGKTKEIKVEPAELREALIAETRQYPGQEKEVFEYFTKTPGALDRLRAPLLEEKVVDHIIGCSTISEKNVSVEELRATPDKMDAEAEAKLTPSQLKKSA